MIPKKSFWISLLILHQAMLARHMDLSTAEVNCPYVQQLSKLSAQFSVVQFSRKFPPVIFANGGNGKTSFRSSLQSFSERSIFSYGKFNAPGETTIKNSADFASTILVNSLNLVPVIRLNQSLRSAFVEIRSAGVHFAISVRDTSDEGFNILPKYERLKVGSVVSITFFLTILMLGLCLVATLRQSGIVWFCLYLALTLLFVLLYHGLQSGGAWSSDIQLDLYVIALLSFYVVNIWFANIAMQLDTRLPLFARTRYLIFAVIFIIAVGGFLPDRSDDAIIAMMGALNILHFIVVFRSLLVKNVKCAYLFFAAHAPIVLVSAITIVSLYTKSSLTHLLPGYSIDFVFAWQTLIFSIVLIQQYTVFSREHISQEGAMMDDQKALLNKMVLEQTEEIMAQNDQLLQHQEEIKLQNEKLESQNRAYEELKELILRQNHELESAVRKRTLQLAESHDELKKHLHQVEQFGFISAHNLRAPVARILGLASIFDRSKVLGDENLSILDRIVASAKDLDIIIHDLGTILDTQKSTNENTEVIDVRQLLDKILFRFETELGKEKIQITITTEATQILAVPAYMDSILSNLISNSIKYKAEDKPPSIQIKTEELPSGWKIQIEDNGLGFDSKQVEKKLFEPFQRFHTHKEGKGLGMFLVKTQVVAMQGSIELHSEPGKGTRVQIIIPRRKLQKIA